jgi:hypothetical protein
MVASTLSATVNSTDIARTPREKSSIAVLSSRLFSRIIVLWLFLGFFLVQSQSPVFATSIAIRHNFFRRNYLASSNPVACLGEANPDRKISLDHLSNSGPAVRLESEGTAIGPNIVTNV